MGRRFRLWGAAPVFWEELVKLEHSFTVPADLDTVWQAVLDPERVAPCMPGATLTEVEGDTFKGSVKVKVGPISLLYKGAGEFMSQDAEARTVVIKASGKDSRGNGTAAATVTVALRADGDTTVGSVETDLSITGKPAQFGRGLISEVGGKILDTFATCLATKLGSAPETPAAPTLSVVKDPPASADPTRSKPTAAETVAAEATATAAEEAGVASAAAAAVEHAEAAAVAADHAEAAEHAEAAAVKRAEAAAVAADHAEAVATGRKAGEATAANAAAAKKPRLAAAPEPETEPIDLLSYAGPSILKRAAPLLALAAAVLTFITLRRRHR